MLLTALAIFLVLGGAEALLFASAQAWLAHMLGPAGAVLATVLMIALPTANIFISWFAARRIVAGFATKRQQDRPIRRRIVGQHQF
jgi:hypothetical protein